MTNISSKPDAVATFNVLRVPVRIEMIRLIQQHGVPMSLDTLATHVAEWADDDPAGGEATIPASRWEIRLHHVHVPRLVDAGILDYDGAERTITAVDEERLDSLSGAEERTLTAIRDGRSRTLRGDGTGVGGQHATASETLTDKQRDLLTAAHQRGYFEVPRQIALSELADEQGLASADASEKLRRGLNRLLRGVDLER